MWNMRTVQVVPIVVGLLGSVTKTWASGWECRRSKLVPHYYKKIYTTGNGEDFEKGVGTLARVRRKL